MRRTPAGRLTVFWLYIATIFTAAVLGLLVGLVYITWR